MCRDAVNGIIMLLSFLFWVLVYIAIVPALLLIDIAIKAIKKIKGG